MRHKHTGTVALSRLLAMVCLAALAHQAAAQDERAVPGLLISSARQVNLTHVFNDSDGFRWDIPAHGGVHQGTNNTFGSGMQLQIQTRGAASIFTHRGRAAINAAGDEIQLGPFTAPNVRVYRRIKVYPDRPLARWLEIFENTSDTELTLNVQHQSGHPYGVTEFRTNAGADRMGPQDWAYIVYSRRGGAVAATSALHVVRDPRSPLAPRLDVAGNQVRSAWTLTIPPRQRVVLCSFVSQGRGEGFEQTLSQWRTGPLLDDLPVRVRGMIVNFPAGPILARVPLTRPDQSDAVALRRGDTIFGQVANRQFTIYTPYGPHVLAPPQVAGMVATGDGQDVLVVTTDGQFITGQLPDQALVLRVPDGGTLSIPPHRLAQWAYQVSEQRPAELPFKGPYLVGHDGSRLAFEPSSLRVRFLSRHGEFDLTGLDIQQVRLDPDANGSHQIIFRNGSSLSGLLLPETFEVSLRMGFDGSYARSHLVRIEYTDEDHPGPGLTRLALVNGDVLHGRIADRYLSVRTDYGDVRVQPSQLRTVTFVPERIGRVIVTLWDGSVLRGDLTRETVGFQIQGGPAFDISSAECVSISRPHSLPPDQVTERVRDLVRRLGSESFQEREEATEALRQLGQGVVPVLEQLLEQAVELEVRQRLQDVLDSLQPSAMIRQTGAGPHTVPADFQGIIFGP